MVDDAVIAAYRLALKASGFASDVDEWSDEQVVDQTELIMNRCVDFMAALEPVVTRMGELFAGIVQNLGPALDAATPADELQDRRERREHDVPAT